MKMKYFKTISILVASLILFSAAAAEKSVHKVRSFEVVDARYGKFNIEVRDVGHPVLIPLQMTIKFTCSDNRKNKKVGLAPKEEVLVDGRLAAQICKYEGYTYDPASQTLIVDYKISQTTEGEGKCDTRVEQPYYLNELCADFN